MRLRESEKRFEGSESADAREEASSEDGFAGVAWLDWLRLRKLLLPMRRKRPRGCCEAGDDADEGRDAGLGLGDGAAASVLTAALDELAALLAPTPPSKLRMLLLRPKNLRRLKPELDVDGVAEWGCGGGETDAEDGVGSGLLQVAERDRVALAEGESERMADEEG